MTVLAAMGADAAEPIAQLLVDGNRDRRFFAALAAIEARPSDCIDLLADRLFDQDHGVRAAAAAALQGFSPRATDVALIRVRHALHHGDLEMMRAACDATARLGDALAVPDLIELFGRGQRQGELARSALIAITRHDFGDDVGPWRAWWAENEKRHRVDWLIDAIERTDLPLRNAAAQDLRQLATRHPEVAPPDGSFLYSPLAWKMWWATITGAGARVRVSTAPPFGRQKTSP
ncbi:MAG: hypothetical protein IPL79_19300 [Myxococcales bacterium]|nr:hypothetical protein [Myxococcales bacterium]